MTAEPRPKRADARRNEQALLDAAAAVFTRAGVDAPVRDVAAEAGVGMGTIYRHFPTRADLVVAVYRHQLDALAEGLASAATGPSPYAALRSWVDGFADFLVTKHGLAHALHSDSARFESLHAELVERLVPALDELLRASTTARQTRADVRALDLLRGIGNLCIGAEDSDYDARAMIGLVLDGLRVPEPARRAPATRRRASR